MARRDYLEQIEQNGIVYGRTFDCELFICNGRNSHHTTINIPEQVSEMPVVGVDENAFANTNIKNIVLPKTVVVIENYAFQNALNLKTVKFEADAVMLGFKAFANCFRLQKVIGNKLETVSSFAFSQCKNLVEIKADFVGEVFTDTFRLCKRLTELSFADGIKIHNDAFYGCMAIHTLYFAHNVEFSDKIRKFVEKRKIVCLGDCPLTELAYAGTDVTIKSV